MIRTEKSKFSSRKLFENVLSLLLAGGLAYLFVIKADPLGFDAASKSYAESVFYRVVGASETLNRWFYSGDHSSEYGQSHTAMVWVQDDDLQATGTLWPMPYVFHSKIINNLLEYEPLAIFVDISFTDARKDETLPELAKTLRKAHEKNIPVFVASLAADHPEKKILPELAAACARVIPTYRMDPDADGIERSYHLIHSEIGTHQTEFEKLCGFDPALNKQSPAVALYSSFLKAKGESFNPDRFHEPMEVFWAMGRTPGINQKLYHCKSKEVFSPRPDQSTLDLIWKIFTGRFFGDLKQDCPHTPVVKVRDILNTNANDAEAKALFSGKLVLYGANIKGAGDEIVEPTHSARMPGVYLHAMALDNLLVFGEDYKRLNENAETCALILLLAFFGIVPAIYHSISREAHEQPVLQNEITEKKFTYPRHLAHVIFLFLMGCICWMLFKALHAFKQLAKYALMVSVILLVCAYFYFCQNVAPMNWIKFIGVSIVYEVVESRFIKAGYIHHFNDWVISIILISNHKGDQKGCAQFMACFLLSCPSGCKPHMRRIWDQLRKLTSLTKS